eukprot:tig00000865_g5066.t1
MATAQAVGSGGRIEAFIPLRLLADKRALEQVTELDRGVSLITLPGAALFIDVGGFSAMARSFTRSDKAVAAEKLSSTLNEYFELLVCRLHSHHAEVLFYAGDAVVAFIPSGEGVRSTAEACKRALAAALEVRAIDFERNGQRLSVHTGLGVGEMEVHAARAGPGAVTSLYTGDLIRQVCEALSESKGRDIVLSREAAALLSPSRRLAVQPAGDHFRLVFPAKPPTWDPLPGPRCSCSAALGPDAPAALAALAARPAFDPACLAPAAAPMLQSVWGEMRPVVVLFASFPELDASRGGGLAACERFGEVARSVFRAAEEWGGSVNKLFLDEKGASALVAWGLPGGYTHEDDGERAVRAALALQAYFASRDAPFVCGISVGRTFCGPLGSSCRKEYALMGDSIILAARLMTAARGSSDARQQALCDAAVVAAATARGRSAAERPGSAGGVSRASSAGPRGRARCLGRDGEMEQCARAVEAAAGGRGSTIVIEGEAGYGKTELARGVRRLCAAREFAVLRAAAEAQTTPLWALRAILRSVAPASSAEALREALAGRGLLTDADCLLLWAALYGEKRAGAHQAAAAGAGAERGETAAEGKAGMNRRGSYAGRQGAGLVGVGLLSEVGHALARLVESLAGPRRRPVALFCEDLHWADSASWFVLRLVRDIAPRLLLVITARPMPAPPRDYLILSGGAPSRRTTGPRAPGRPPPPRSPSPSLPPTGRAPRAAPSERAPPSGPAPRSPRRRASGSGASAGRGGAGLRALRRVPQRAVEVALLRLQPLPREAAADLLHGLSEELGVAWQAGAVDVVLRKAAGVPLYIVELCHSVAKGGGGAGAAEGPALPDTIQQIVLSRMDKLDAPARLVVQLAAVIDTGFTLDALTAAHPAGDASREAVRAALRTLAELRLVRAGPGVALLPGEGKEGEGEGAGWPPPRAPFYFAHALVRDAVHSSLTAAQRREVHGRVALFLEREGDGDPALLALHWRLAEDFERALHHLVRAARRAMEANALVEARRLLAEAVCAVDDLRLAGPATPRLPGRLRASAGVPDTAATLSAALQPRPEAYAKYAHLRTLALRDWAYCEYYSGRHEICLDASMACVAGVRWPVPTRDLSPLGLLKMVGRVLKIVSGTPRSAKRQQAAPGEEPLAGRAYGAPERPAADLRREEEFAATECYIIVGWAAFKTTEEEKGAHALALGMSTALLGMTAAYSCEVEHWSHGRGTCWFAVLLHILGMHKQSARFIQQAREMGERLRDERVLEATHSAGGYIDCYAGRFESALRNFDTSVERYLGWSNPMFVYPSTYAAFVCVIVGRFREAEERAAALEEYLKRVGLDDYSRLIMAMVLGFSAMLQGRDEVAGSLLARIRGASEAWWIGTSGTILRGLYAWRARGDWRAMHEATAQLLALWRRDFDASSWLLTLARGETAARLRALEEARAGASLGCFGPRLRGTRVSPRGAYGEEAEEPGALQRARAEAKEAAAFARDVVGMLERTHKRFIPPSAPSSPSPAPSASPAPRSAPPSLQPARQPCPTGRADGRPCWRRSGRRRCGGRWRASGPPGCAPTRSSPLPASPTRRPTSTPPPPPPPAPTPSASPPTSASASPPSTPPPRAQPRGRAPGNRYISLYV